MIPVAGVFSMMVTPKFLAPRARAMVASTIDDHPGMSGQLRLVFFPLYVLIFPVINRVPTA